ncbi:MAG: Antitoxin Phd YefM, type toxin-antitoxin system [Fibrobacterota bacterium]|jgi:prevent-host-death family protein
MNIPIAEFKARCLGLIDDLRNEGGSLVVTKHGRPVAKMLPYQGEDTTPEGLSRVLRIHGELP